MTEKEIEALKAERDWALGIVSRLHPDVLRMLTDARHAQHRFYWSLRCMVCGPQNKDERRLAAEILAKEAKAASPTSVG